MEMLVDVQLEAAPSNSLGSADSEAPQIVGSLQTPFLVEQSRSSMLLPIWSDHNVGA